MPNLPEGVQFDDDSGPRLPDGVSFDNEAPSLPAGVSFDQGGPAQPAIARRRLQRMSAATTPGATAPPLAERLTAGQRAAQKALADQEKHPIEPKTSGPGWLAPLRRLTPTGAVDVMKALSGYGGADSLAEAGPAANPAVAGTPAPAAPPPRAVPPRGAAGSRERLGQALAARTLQPAQPTPNVPSYEDVAAGQDADVLGGQLGPEASEQILKHQAESKLLPFDPANVTKYLDSPEGQAAITAMGAQVGVSPDFMRGGVHAAASMASMATDPKMAAIGAAAKIPVVGPVLSAGFAVQMAHDLIKNKAAALGEAIGSGDRAAAMDVAGQAIPELLMAGTAGAHAAGGAGRLADRAIGVDKIVDAGFRGDGKAIAGDEVAQAIDQQQAGAAARQRVAEAGMGPVPTLEDKLELLRLNREVEALKAQVADVGGPAARGPFTVPPDVKGPVEVPPEDRAAMGARLTPQTSEGNVPPSEEHPGAVPYVPEAMEIPPELEATRQPPVTRLEKPPGPEPELAEPRLTPAEWDARRADAGPPEGLAERREPPPPELGGPERREGPRRAETRPMESDRRVRVAEETGLAPDHPAVERLAAAEEQLRTSAKTGLPNTLARTEWETPENLKTHPVAGFFDLDDFKQLNTEMGHENVDTHVLTTVGKVMQRVQAEMGDKVQAWHDSGDEFSFRAVDDATGNEFASRVNSLLGDAEFKYQDADGNVHVRKGVGGSHGLGPDLKQAEQTSKLAKAERKAAGLRKGVRDVGEGTPEGKPPSGGSPPVGGDGGGLGQVSDTGGGGEPVRAVAGGGAVVSGAPEAVSSAAALERAATAVPQPKPEAVKVPLSEKLAKVSAEVARNVEDALNQAGSAKVVVLEDPKAAPGLRRLVVSRDPSSDKWRITRMSEDGEPTGHSTHATREDAIRSAAGGFTDKQPPIGSKNYKVIDTRGVEGLPEQAPEFAREDTVSFRGKTWEVEDVQGGYILKLRRLTSGGARTFDRVTVDTRNVTLEKVDRTEAPSGERAYRTSLSQRLAQTVPSEVKGVTIPNALLEGIADLRTFDEAQQVRDAARERLRTLRQSGADPKEIKLASAIMFLAEDRMRVLRHGDDTSGSGQFSSLAARVRALNEQRAMEREAKAKLASGEIPPPPDGETVTDEDVAEAVRRVKEQTDGIQREGGTAPGESPQPTEGVAEAPRPAAESGSAELGAPEAERRAEQDRHEYGGVGENRARGGPAEEGKPQGAAEGNTGAGAPAGGGGEGPRRGPVGYGTELLDPAKRAKAAEEGEREVGGPEDDGVSVGAAAVRGFGRPQEPGIMDWLMAKLKGRPEPERVHTSVKAHLADIFGHDTLHEAAEIDPTRRFERAAAGVGGARTHARTMLVTATREMLAALRGDKTELDRVHLFLLDGALQDAKMRWNDMAAEVKRLSDQELYEKAKRGDFTTPLSALDRTSAFEGADLEKNLYDKIGDIEHVLNVAASRKDSPQSNVQQAKAVFDRLPEAIQQLRDFLSNTTEAAAASIGRINLGRDANDIPIDREPYGRRPDVKKAVAIWKERVSDPLLEAHLKNEGSFDQRYYGKTAGAFYPLVPVDKDVATPHDIPRTPFAQARNLQNRFRTGVGSGYRVDPDAISQYVQSVMRRSAQTNLYRTGANMGIIKLVEKADDRPDVMTVGGKTYKTSPIVPLDHMGTKRGYMPLGIYQELKPVLEDAGQIKTFVDKLADTAMHVATFGIGEGVLHNASMWGRYAVSTPFLNHGLMSALNTPMTKGLLAGIDMFSMDPSSKEYGDLLMRLSRIGALPERVGSMTTDPQLAKAAGLEKRMKVSMGAAIYGPEGMDARMRVGAAKIALAVNPDITDAQLYDYMKQFGVYNHQLQSIAARFFKGSKLGQFYTAGYSGIRAGLDSALGTGRTPFGSEKGTGARKYKAQQIVSAGLASATAYWMLMSKANTGKWPWEDKDTRFLQIKLTPEQRASGPGRALFGDDLTKNAYVSPFSGFLGVNMVERGARILGVRALTEGLAQGKEPWQIELDGLKDFINGTTHQMLGPPIRALAAPFNLSPSIRSLYDPRTKQFRVEPQRLGFGKIESTGDLLKRMGAGELEAINPTSSAIFKGIHTKAPVRTLADMFPVVKLTGPANPVESESPRQKAIADIREGKTPDLSGVRPKGINALYRDAAKSADEVRYNHMPFEKLLDAYDAESNPDKKSAIYRVIAQRAPRAATNLPPASMGKTLERFSSLR